MTISNKEKLREIERELGQRKHVYPRLIDSGRLSQEKADRQTEIMREIAQDYRERIEAEEAKGRLL